MQVEEESMVRDEYPIQDEVKKEGNAEETAPTEETNHDDDDVDEEMNYAVDEEHSDDVSEYLEDGVYPEADVYVGMKALEDELDHLQTALDHLERKNDDIHAQLTELLQSNREARKQFRESLQVEGQQSK
ncbi:uncharacterized protein LOC143907276 [Temnothorax americanus]|uniref:uncharacterized protein LOC143907276 n=1 Tax=Temnothorax americanus TaxID=1964332 RepID=UPI004067E7DC